MTSSIAKPITDDRIYHNFVLSNKLSVLLVSDPTSEKSGAAMDVHVGHFSDPDDVAGLAHFLEHMLFLGTKKYPEEGSYQD
jgi:insulysin